MLVTVSIISCSKKQSPVPIEATSYQVPLIGSGNFSFGSVNSSYESWQIYDGNDLFKYRYAPTNIVLSIFSSNWNHCIRQSISVNKQ